MTTQPPEKHATTDDLEGYDEDTRLLASVVGALDASLALIDARPGLTPGEQLATIAVGAVRALVPALHDELDRRLA